MGSYLVAKGTDGYTVVSSYETLAAVHQGLATVADSRDRKLLGADGVFKLVLSSDKRQRRWVRNLTSLKIENSQREQDFKTASLLSEREFRADSSIR